MKVWEIVMVPREFRTELEVRDLESWAVLYDTVAGKPLAQSVGELDVVRIENLGEENGDKWITVYAS